MAALSVTAGLAHAGGVHGGGGNIDELPVYEVRVDILKWISEGGAKGLKLPSGVSYEFYQSSMSKILLDHAVIITAVTTAQENASTDLELKVLVNGQPKMCRGFVSVKDGLDHLLCNSDRLKAATPADRYRLIHHEYAGLAGVEQNVGASSDYQISDQITDYLVPETVWRLSVKKPAVLGKTWQDTLIGDYYLVNANGNGGDECSRYLHIEPAAVYVNPSSTSTVKGVKFGAADRVGHEMEVTLGNRTVINEDCGGWMACTHEVSAKIVGNGILELKDSYRALKYPPDRGFISDWMGDTIKYHRQLWLEVVGGYLHYAEIMHDWDGGTSLANCLYTPAQLPSSLK